MEWTVLLLLIPAVVIPVVLLWGFAGCGFEAAGGYGPIEVPESVVGSVISSSVINVSWTHASAIPVTFEIERTKVGGDAVVLPGPFGGSPIADLGLEEATTYFYRVRAKSNYGTTSEWSTMSGQVTTLSTTVVFQPTFEANLTADDISMAGWTVIQRIPASTTRPSGTKVRITLRGSTNAALRISRVYISPAGPAGYNAVGTPVPVVTNESTIPMGAPAFPLPIVDYTFDRTQPQLVAFDVSPMNTGRIPSADAAPDGSTGVGYLGPGSDMMPRNQASQPVRSPDYITHNKVFLVTLIEVA